MHLTTHSALLMAAFVVVSVVLGSWIVSGKWRELAVRFGSTADPPRGETRFGFQSLRMSSGLGGYQHCVTIGVSDRGISLSLWAPMRLFHPPLLIPWRSIRSCEPRDLMWHKGRQVNLGDGDGFWIQGKAAEAVGARWEALSDGRAA